MIRYLIDKLYIKQPKFRRLVTTILYGNGDVDVNFCGTTLHVNKLRENGYVRAARASSWSSALRDEVPILMNLMSIFRNGDTFVDIGANVGLYTRTFSRLRNLYPEFRLIAFEPHPSTYERLSTPPLPGVEYHNHGIGSRNETVEFVDGAVSHVFTRRENANAYNIASEAFSVDIKRLDEVLCESEGLFVLKIDVEGQELSVIEGAKSLFESNRI